MGIYSTLREGRAQMSKLESFSVVIALSMLVLGSCVDGSPSEKKAADTASHGSGGTTEGTRKDRLKERLKRAYSIHRKAASASSPDEAKRLFRQALTELETVLGKGPRVGPLIQASIGRCLAWSSDGRYLAFSNAKHEVVLLDLKYRHNTVLTGHRAVVTDIAFSPDDMTVVAASESGEVRLWDRRTREERHVLKAFKAAVTSVAFSRQGDVLITTSKNATLWKALSGKKIGSLDAHVGGVSSADFSPNGELVATVDGDGHARLWSTATGRLVKKIAATKDRAPSWRARLTGVDFSPDGNTVLITGPRAPKLWNIRSGELERELKINGGDRARAAQFHPSGRKIFAHTSLSLVLWELAEKKSKLDRRPLSQGIRTMAVAPSGNQVAIIDQAGALSIRTLTTNQLTTFISPLTRVSSHVFSPDGQMIAVPCTDGAVRLLDAKTGAVLHRYSEAKTRFSPTGMVRRSSLSWVAFSPSGEELVTESDHVPPHRLWSTQSGEEIEMPFHRLRSFSPREPKFSPDGKYIVAHSRSVGTGLALWDREGGKLTRTSGLGFMDSKSMAKTTFSPNGKMVAERVARRGAFRGQLRLLDTKTGKELHRLTSPDSAVSQKHKYYAIYSADFSPDSTMIAARVGKKDSGLSGRKVIAGLVWVWDTRSGDRVREIKLDRECTRSRKHVPGALFTPDGKSLVVGCTRGEIQVWSAGWGKRERTIRHARPSKNTTLSGASLSLDGKRLVTYGLEPTSYSGRKARWAIKAWEFESGKMLNRFEDTNLTPGEGLAISPAGKVAIVKDWPDAESGRLAGLGVWHVDTGKRLGTSHLFAGQDAGFVETDSGEFEVFGEPGLSLVCRLGAATFPIEVCKERRGRSGLLQKALATRERSIKR